MEEEEDGEGEGEEDGDGRSGGWTGSRRGRWNSKEEALEGRKGERRGLEEGGRGRKGTEGSEGARSWGGGSGWERERSSSFVPMRSMSGRVPEMGKAGRGGGGRMKFGGGGKGDLQAGHVKEVVGWVDEDSAAPKSQRWRQEEWKEWWHGVVSVWW
jgi:hypothetical protein